MIALLDRAFRIDQHVGDVLDVADLLGSATQIDLRLVEPSLLSPVEAAWLDAYHARVRAALEPLVDDGTRAWLVQATRPIAA